MSGSLLFLMSTASTGVALPDFTLWNTDVELQGYTFDGTDITALGNASPGTNLALADRGGIAGMSADSLVVAGSDNFNDRDLAKYTFDGSDWNLDGNIFTLSISFPAVCALSTTRAGLGLPGSGTQSYDFTDPNWAAIGSNLSDGGARYMGALSSSTAVRLNVAQTELSLYSFNGTVWSASKATALGFTANGVSPMTATRIAVFDTTNNLLWAYDEGVSSYAQVGNSLSISGVGNACICALSATQIVFGDNAAGTLQVYEFDGADWSTVGNELTSVLVPEYNNLANASYLLI